MKELLLLPHVSPDIGGRSRLWEYIQKCIYTTSYQSPAEFPEPTVLHAGLFSPKLNKYYEEVPRKAWSKASHPNGSVTYSYSDVTFNVSHCCFPALLCPSRPDMYHLPSPNQNAFYFFFF